MSILAYVKSDRTGSKMLEVGGPGFNGYWYRVWTYNADGSAKCVGAGVCIASAIEAGVKAMDEHPDILGIVTEVIDGWSQPSVQLKPYQRQQGPHIVHVPRLVSIPEAADALLKLRERAKLTKKWSYTSEPRTREQRNAERA